MARRASMQRIWRKLSTFNIRKTKLTAGYHERLFREHATPEPTLVVHPEWDYRPYFPNAFSVTKEGHGTADLYVDRYYRGLQQIEPSSYGIIFCTGLLEHVPDPQKLIDDFHRILKPGGKLVLAVSAVFSFHECPDNFFHFTPYGLRLLFKEWTSVSIKGASQSFETIGILLQRINLQCEILFLVRPLVELLAHVVPLLDRFIIRQYNTLQVYERDECLSDSMMPSNLLAIALK